jgi:pimeloyl-ACP methyl ester carboxylesterase
VGAHRVSVPGQHLRERMTPGEAERHAEVVAPLTSPEASDGDMTESLRLLWPGYFADRANAMPFPPEMRASLATYVMTMGSVAEHLDSGFAATLADLNTPAVLVLGEQSPMPVSQGEQTAALLPTAEVAVIPGAGHMPWYEKPGCVAAALTRIHGNPRLGTRSAPSPRRLQRPTLTRCAEPSWGRTGYFVTCDSGVVKGQPRRCHSHGHPCPWL